MVCPRMPDAALIPPALTDNAFTASITLLPTFSLSRCTRHTERSKYATQLLCKLQCASADPDTASRSKSSARPSRKPQRSVEAERRLGCSINRRLTRLLARDRTFSPSRPAGSTMAASSTGPSTLASLDPASPPSSAAKTDSFDAWHTQEYQGLYDPDGRPDGDGQGRPVDLGTALPGRGPRDPQGAYPRHLHHCTQRY